MAHYKRGYPRTVGGAHLSEVTHRKRLGLKPYVVPEWDGPIGGRRDEYRAFCEWRRLTCWPNGSGKVSSYGHPKWHDVLYHNRPRRRKEAELLRAVLKGAVHHDEALWPLSRRPHCYYW